GFEGRRRGGGEGLAGFEDESDCRRHRGAGRSQRAPRHGKELTVLFHLLAPLADQFGPLNLFRYITFRSGGAFLTALLLSFLVGGRLIEWLRSKQGRGQPIRDDGPESHLLTKKGTPTMGGFLILITLVAGTLLWADLRNRYVWIVMLL